MNFDSKYNNPRLLFVEQAIIGKLLIGKAENIVAMVFSTDIYHDNIRKLFDAITDYYIQHGAISRSVIYDKAENMGLFGKAELKLWEAEATEEDSNALISELKDFRLKRDIQEMLTRAEKEVLDPNISSGSILNGLIRGVNSVQSDLDVRYYDLNEIRHQLLNEDKSRKLILPEPDLERMYANVGSHTHQTEVHVAESKHGKTTYACYRTAQYANQGYVCLYFTLEGSRFDIYEKLHGQVKPEMFKNVIVVDKAFKASEIVSKINEVSITRNIDFVCVDYIQRVFQEDGKYQSEIEKVSNASIEITSTILKHGIFGLILAQPRKIDQQRKGWNRFPTVDDVYGTGQIIKDAYCVTAGFRPILVNGMLYRHAFMDREGVMLPNGRIYSRNSYFVRMLICRKGELYRKQMQFVQDNETIILKNEDGDPANDYTQV